jgi:two-component system chemotaxis response regulator CheY
MPAMNATPPKRLLVTDDAMIMRTIIKDIARQAGWEIAGEAASGVECISKYRETRPDLVTLDIVMPEMDGVEALRAIRREHPDAQVVMVSALDQKAKLSECIALGALDFIVKPFDRERLLSLFRTYGTGVSR